MKSLIYLTLTSLIMLIVTPITAHASIHVFACEPEWASLAKELGGDKIETYTATNAHQDPHHIRAKPSLIAAMRKADLVVCSGASLEAGWLPILLQKAGHPNVQPGGIGYMQAATVVPVLEKPVRLDRSEGDIHPEGNPHVQLNPHNISLVASALLERLKAIDPGSASFYQRRYDVFNNKWNNAIATWETEASELKGVPVIVHHKSFIYLLDWLGMQELGTLEAKPGIPPTTAHLESLLQSLKIAPAQMILRTPYDPEDASKWLSEKTAIPAVELPFTVGGDDQSSDLFGLFDRTIAILRGANHAQQ